MKRTEPQSIRAVLEQAIADCDMQSQLLRVRAASLWPLIAGRRIADICGRPFFRKDVMFVPVSKASVRQELTMMRSSLAKTINDTLGEHVVAEMKFIGVSSKNVSQP